MTETTDGYRPNPEGVKTGKDDEMLEIFLREIDFGNVDLRAKIKEIIGRPESFLGKGGTAQVYDLGDQCIKIMPNRHADKNARSYNLGNPVSTECQIQNQLRGVDVDGVYAPRALSFYEGAKITAIVMERLDAANMQMVINGRENLPDNFLSYGAIKCVEDIEAVLDSFFDALQNYVLEMHERGVVHCDLVPRNIMIDKETGKPRLIDFGRSRKISTGIKSIPENELKLMEKDLEDLEKARGAMEKYLKSKLK